MRLFVRVLFLCLTCVSFTGCKSNLSQNSNTNSVTKETQARINFAPTLRVMNSVVDYEGSIVFIEERGQPNFRLAKFDLETKEITTIFQIPQGAWVYQLDASTDSKQLVLSYTEPSEETSFDRSGIYLLDLETNAEPQLLLGSDEAFVYYYDPVFSTDNTFVYYIVSDSVRRSLRLERINLESNEVILIAENALWPKVSPDGTSITYLSINQETQDRSLIKANLDGSNPQTLITENQLGDLDLPFYSADGDWIYVSVPKEQTEESSLWQNLLGIASLAYAHGNHDVPSDWWRISSNGSEPEQVTQESVIHYYGDVSASNTVGYTGTKGFYIFDGEESKLLLGSRALRAFTWLE